MADSKRVLIIAGVLVLALGGVVLWLSVDAPPPGAGDTVLGKNTPPPIHAEAERKDEPGETAPLTSEPTQAKVPLPDNDSGFRPITQIQSGLHQPQSSTVVQPAAEPAADASGQAPPSANSAAASPSVDDSGTAAGPGQADGNVSGPAPGGNPAARRPRPKPARIARATEPPEAPVIPEPGPDQPVVVQPDRIASPPPAPEPVMARRLDERTGSVRRRQRPPAPAGRYETITTATARAGPTDAGPIVDSIRRGTMLNVTGSDGDWLVVYSKRRNITVYVHRDEAMLSTRRAAASTSVPESEWPRVEDAIRQAFIRNNVVGVEATFIGNTAYLKGTVKTDRERDRAEIFARSVLEVKHVFNGIRVE